MTHNKLILIAYIVTLGIWLAKRKKYQADGVERRVFDRVILMVSLFSLLYYSFSFLNFYPSSMYLTICTMVLFFGFLYSYKSKNVLLLYLASLFTGAVFYMVETHLSVIKRFPVLHLVFFFLMLTLSLVILIFLMIRLFKEI
jgi:hypothetical protein